MTYIPVYCRPPNKLVRYEEIKFTCKAGYPGIERMAVFLDKNGKEQRTTAQIIWLKELYGR